MPDLYELFLCAQRVAKVTEAGKVRLFLICGEPFMVLLLVSPATADSPLRLLARSRRPEADPHFQEYL